MIAAAALLLPLLLGLSILCAGLGRVEPRPGIGLMLALSVGMGLGLGSAIHFACMAVGYPVAALPLEAVLICTLYAGTRRNLARAREQRVTAAAGGTLAVVALGSAATAAVVSFARLTRETPYGWWDAWAVWNLRARFLTRLGAHWEGAFTAPGVHGVYGHIDYPPMLPVTIARLWTDLGSESERVPQLVALAFGAATVAVAVGAIARNRGVVLAAACGLAILAIPEMVLVSSYQYADVPLVFFLTAAMVLLRLGDEAAGVGPTALAGVAASLAAWTKNEGIAALGALALAHTMAVAPGTRARAWRPFLLGAAPVLALLALFKLRYAPISDIIAGQGTATVRRILDLRRYGLIALGFWDWFADHWLAIAAMGTAVVVLGMRVEAAERPGARRAAFFVVSMSLVYLGVFVTTPYEVSWHMRTALPRLVVHLWPIFAIMTFSVLRARQARDPAAPGCR